MMNKLFKIYNLKDVKFSSYNVLKAKDEENNILYFTLSKDLEDYFYEDIKVSKATREALFSNCKKAFDVLIKENFNKEYFEERCTFITYEDKIITIIDNGDENYEYILNEIKNINSILEEESNVATYKDGVLELRFNVFPDSSGRECSFMDIIINVDKGNYEIYTGYETSVSINDYRYPIIPVITKIFETKESFNYFISNNMISNNYNDLLSELPILKSSVNDEKYFYGCTADLLVTKLKKLHIKTKQDKSGMLSDIENFDYYIGNKLISAINSLGEKYKTLLKSTNIVIPDEHKFTTIEFLTVLSCMYYLDDFNVTIKDLYEFIISLDVKAPEPKLEELHIG